MFLSRNNNRSVELWVVILVFIICKWFRLLNIQKQLQFNYFDIIDKISSFLRCSKQKITTTSCFWTVSSKIWLCRFSFLYCMYSLWSKRLVWGIASIESLHVDLLVWLLSAHCCHIELHLLGPVDEPWTYIWISIVRYEMHI